MNPPLRFWLAAALLPWAVLLPVAAATAPYWPNTPGLATFARILEGLVPQAVLVGLAGLAALAALRAPPWALALTAAASLGTVGLTGTRHLSVAATIIRDRPAEMTLLWFNLLNSNITPPEELAAQLIASPADIVILAEATALAGQRESLAKAFPVQVGCGTPRCSLLVLSRRPNATVEIRTIGRAAEQRLAVVTVPRAEGPSLNVVGLHLVKPWFFGFSESEDWDAIHALRQLPGPLVLMGDLNTAPWSKRVHTLARRCGLAPSALPRPTWPARAGWFGIPIDLVLVRGGAALTYLEHWGAGLGSNHLGLLAGVTAPAGKPALVPKSCRPPKTRWQTQLPKANMSNGADNRPE